MPTVNEVAEILVDADTLWKAVGDFGTAARWHPQVSGVTVIDGPAGRTRLIQFKTGGEQLERLEALDGRHRVYRYSIERTSLPVRDYTGEFRVEVADTYRSRLVWEAQFTLADDGDGRTVEAVRHFLHDGAARIQTEYGRMQTKSPA